MNGHLLAEREGFEPSFPCGKHALQACALGQTTRPLQINQLADDIPQAQGLYHRYVFFIDEQAVLPGAVVASLFQDSNDGGVHWQHGAHFWVAKLSTK